MITIGGKGLVSGKNYEFEIISGVYAKISLKFFKNGKKQMYRKLHL